MFGLLGWLFGASAVSALLAILSKAVFNAIVPEITAATAAARGALFTAVWAGTTGVVGHLGFNRKINGWRKKGSLAKGKEE